jgi:hypothetical protein
MNSNSNAYKISPELSAYFSEIGRQGDPAYSGSEKTAKATAARKRNAALRHEQT